jgi:DNA-binding MarR family transcriptional regulator
MSLSDEFSRTATVYLGVVRETASLVLTLAERLQRGFAAHAGEFGLTAAQAKVLLRLGPEESIPMRTLARSLGYDPSNLTGLVDKLEDRGLIERRPDPADRRVKAIVITEEGRRLRDGFRGRLVGDAGALGALSQSQVKELRDLLQVALTQN